MSTCAGALHEPCPKSSLIHPVGVPLLAGLFEIVVGPENFRLVFDRRPQNAGERRLVWLRLPPGSMFARLVLRPGGHPRFRRGPPLHVQPARWARVQPQQASRRSLDI